MGDGDFGLGGGGLVLFYFGGNNDFRFGSDLVDSLEGYLGV